MHTELPPVEIGTPLIVTEFSDRIAIRLPFIHSQLNKLAVEQVACTALHLHRQAGRPSAAALIIPSTGADFGPMGCAAMP
ncbi:hypothetical protein [Nocardia terpenica]|uniref:Uncharacterized protein n=1 Tax=Nocardia terpenica TaxID=455432 RepID=A0A291RNP3_9NOCA|nr:hypothetical protein [Nocardia terpenica]ATL69196.1 hypothetical protein CRH09_26460 [Nocardia terpenica]